MPNNKTIQCGTHIRIKKCEKGLATGTVISSFTDSSYLVLRHATGDTDDLRRNEFTVLRNQDDVITKANAHKIHPRGAVYLAGCFYDWENNVGSTKADGFVSKVRLSKMCQILELDLLNNAFVHVAGFLKNRGYVSDIGPHELGKWANAALEKVKSARVHNKIDLLGPKKATENTESCDFEQEVKEGVISNLTELMKTKLNL